MSGVISVVMYRGLESFPHRCCDFPPKTSQNNSAWSVPITCRLGASISTGVASSERVQTMSICLPLRLGSRGKCVAFNHCVLFGAMGLMSFARNWSARKFKFVEQRSSRPCRVSGSSDQDGCSLASTPHQTGYCRHFPGHSLINASTAAC